MSTTAASESDLGESSSTLIVVVLYRSPVVDGTGSSDLVTLRCLEAIYADRREILAGYKILLWDNSPQRWDSRELTLPCEYRHAASEGMPNDGVSGAYNAALRECIRDGCQWMLLLDQDTEVTAAYLAGMLEHRRFVDPDERIAAVAPLLFEKDFQLSPQQVLRHRFRPVDPKVSHVLEDASFAANSGLLVRVAALQMVGGYSLDFWLDYSDIELFHRLYAAGKRIFLAADLRLQHSMTMLDYDGRMTPERYGNFLAAEQAFFDLYRDGRQSAVQMLRLAARVWRQRRYRNPVFSQMTRRFLQWRLTTSKKTRLEQWRQMRQLRLTDATGA